MCVIIHRIPGQDLPFEKLKSACIVNPDGFGVLIPDRGKLEMRRVYDVNGNAADKLAKLFEDAKGLDVYAHLRFRTKGPKDLTNVHPFTVVNKKTDGVDVQFMHNGTLPDFGNDIACDSRAFTFEIVRPLYRMVAAKVGIDKALYDPLFGKLLTKYAGPNSIFTLVDSFGNNLIINKKQGFKFDWGWASNEYSFNRDHRDYGYSTSYSQYKANNYKSSGSTSWVIGENTSSKVDKEFNDELPFDNPTTKAKTTTALPEVMNKTGTPAAIIRRSNMPVTSNRQTFLDVAELHDLSEVTNLSREDIEDLVDEYPEHACLLIQDLITELYDRQQSLKEAA